MHANCVDGLVNAIMPLLGIDRILTNLWFNPIVHTGTQVRESAIKPHIEC